jgi:hypothetical protein
MGRILIEILTKYELSLPSYNRIPKVFCYENGLNYTCLSFIIDYFHDIYINHCSQDPGTRNTEPEKFELGACLILEGKKYFLKIIKTVCFCAEY